MYWCFEEDPKREAWHEAGHATVAHVNGMKVKAIGRTYKYGDNVEPNGSTWVYPESLTLGTKVIGEFGLAGAAAEFLKLGNVIIGGTESDIEFIESHGCDKENKKYADAAEETLRRNDRLFQAVHDRLLAELECPSREPYIDTDNVKRQVLISEEEFNEIVKNNG